MSTTILHISDTHGGQMSGMIAPDTELTYDDGEKRTITLSSTSLWIWEVVEKIIANVNDYAGEDQVYLYHTAETCHGSSFPEYLYSPFQNHQVHIAVTALAKFREIKNLAAIRFCYGSDKHDYGQQSATKEVASQVAAWGYDVQCYDHGVETVDGVDVDWKHKGPRPGHGFDIMSPIRGYTIKSIRGFLERGKRAPDILLSGHWHVGLMDMVRVAWGQLGVSALISVAPPLTGPNEYARQLNHIYPCTRIGAHMIKVENGRILDYQPLYWEREERHRVEGVVCHPFRGQVN